MRLLSANNLIYNPSLSPLYPGKISGKKFTAPSVPLMMPKMKNRKKEIKQALGTNDSTSMSQSSGVMASNLALGISEIPRHISFLTLFLKSSQNKPDECRFRSRRISTQKRVVYLSSFLGNINKIKKKILKIKENIKYQKSISF